MPEAIPSDIRQRVVDDFGEVQAAEIYDLLITRIPDNLPNGTRPRHLRCILHLAKGDRKKLDEFIEACLMDTRDVMLWAEYDATETANPRRVRDFSKPFGQAAIKAKKRSS